MVKASSGIDLQCYWVSRALWKMRESSPTYHHFGIVAGMVTLIDMLTYKKSTPLQLVISLICGLKCCFGRLLKYASVWLKGWVFLELSVSPV